MLNVMAVWLLCIFMHSMVLFCNFCTAARTFETNGTSRDLSTNPRYLLFQDSKIDSKSCLLLTISTINSLFSRICRTCSQGQAS